MRLKNTLALTLLIFTGINSIIGDFFIYALSPNDIEGKVFFFDSQDINGDGTTIGNNSPVSSVKNKFRANDLTQNLPLKQAIYKNGIINGLPAIFFDGNSDIFNLQETTLLSSGTGYTAKTFALVIRTSDDINSFQNIYDEGTKEKGFSIQIENSHLYIGAYNTIDWAEGNKYKIVDMGVIETDTNYAIIFTYDSNNNISKAFLNGVEKSSLSNLEFQRNHSSCSFDSSFDCSIYQSGGTLGIGGTKNDSIKLSNQNENEIYEGNFFKGYLGEFSSYNYALEYEETQEFFDYLFQKWRFDTLQPTITNTNFSSGSILPGGNHSFSFDYNDNSSSTYNSGIDSDSHNIVLEKYNSTIANYQDITSSKIGTGITVNSSQAIYPFENLEHGKYKISFSIDDNAGNSSQVESYIFYIDKPSVEISQSQINIGDLDVNNLKYSPQTNIEVKTIGASYKIVLELENDLESDGNTINNFDGNYGFGYQKNSGLISIDGNEILLQVNRNVNNSGGLNINNHNIKLGSLVDDLQVSGLYTGSIGFNIIFEYN